jgi:hypothetical protein
VSILCTFPGKFGDLLWALPTLRALARRTGEAIDLLTSADMASICPLIAQQGYIGHAYSDPNWIRVHVDTQDRLPPNGSPTPPHRYDHIFHLGYRGWPQRALPFETLDTFNHQQRVFDQAFADADLDLGTPWIQVPHHSHVYVSVGFSDEHFELKYGLWELLTEKLRWTSTLGGNWGSVSGCPGSRWREEGGHTCESWERAAWTISNSSVFLGCNSGLHVLACAIGKPVVMMEPSEARWNPIFFPLGTTGPQVTLVLGNDGKPTWDARHVADTLQRVLTSTPVRTDQERLS